MKSWPPSRLCGNMSEAFKCAFVDECRQNAVATIFINSWGLQLKFPLHRETLALLPRRDHKMPPFAETTAAVKRHRAVITHDNMCVRVCVCVWHRVATIRLRRPAADAAWPARRQHPHPRPVADGSLVGRGRRVASLRQDRVRSARGLSAGLAPGRCATSQRQSSCPDLICQRSLYCGRECAINGSGCHGVALNNVQYCPVLNAILMQVTYAGKCTIGMQNFNIFSGGDIPDSPGRRGRPFLHSLHYGLGRASPLMRRHSK